MDWRAFLFFVAFFVAWFGLNRFVLPYFGISTCCSACNARPAPVYEPERDLPTSAGVTADGPRAGETKDSAALPPR